MAKPYKSISVTDDMIDDGVLDTILDTDRVAATVRDHGIDANEFWAETGRLDGNREPITLGELRDFLGY